MSMFGKIGEWYDAHNGAVLPGRSRLIQVQSTAANLVFAEAVLYGEAGRDAKIGAVVPRVAEAAMASEVISVD